jgi:ABC-2 type transport system permease protein
MWRKLAQFLVLARLTAEENLRQPICLLLTTACIVLTATVPLVQLYDFGEDGKLARNSGLALHFVFGLFLTGYAACTSLSREMRRGTAATVLSKPVSRELFFLAKYAGIAAVVLAFSFCAGIATLLSERVAIRFVESGRMLGYVLDSRTGVLLLFAPGAAFLAAAILSFRTRRTFQGLAFWFLVIALLTTLFVCGFFDRTGRFDPFDARVQWRILPASLLLTQALLVLAAIALGLSTRLPMAPTMTLCCVVFVMGLMSDYLFGRHAETSSTCALIHAVIPNWQHFWVSDALRNGGTLPWSYLGNALLYAITYSAAIISLGILSFRRAEVK